MMKHFHTDGWGHFQDDSAQLTGHKASLYGLMRTKMLGINFEEFVVPSSAVLETSVGRL